MCAGRLNYKRRSMRFQAALNIDSLPVIGKADRLQGLQDGMKTTCRFLEDEEKDDFK